MTGENEKTFTEADMALLLADRVAKETADLTTERNALKAERDELATKLDVAETARTTAEQKAVETEKAFETFKTDLESLREAADRKDARLVQVKDAAPHMGEDFVTDEARIERIVAMSEESFSGYLADLKAVTPEAKGGDIPRESAMAGLPPVTGATKTSAAQSLLMGRYTSKEG